MNAPLPRVIPQAPKKRSSTPQRGRATPSCLWCGGRLTGRHVNTCCASCRSSLSRAKHRACVNALVEIGMPKAAAERLMKDKGLRIVEAKIKKLNYQWYPKLRRFFQPYDAQQRAA